MIEEYRRNESVYRSYPLHSRVFAACESGARFGCARLYIALRVCERAFVVTCAFPCAFSCTRVYKDCFVDVIKVDGSTMATARKMMAAARACERAMDRPPSMADSSLGAAGKKEFGESDLIDR